ncbi:heme exporter protein CcmD [Hyphococcus lacteus]
MYGHHTPYIIAAYGVSFVVIAALIFIRMRAHKTATEATKRLEH